MMRSMTTVCRDAFQALDTHFNGLLSFAQISAVATQFGLVPRCREEQDMMKRLLENADADGSGSFEFHEFEVVLQLMGERLRAVQCFEEQLFAESLKITRQELSEIRSIYCACDLDRDNELSL